MKLTDKNLFIIIWILYYIYGCMNSIVFEKGSAITIVANAVLFIYLFFYTIRKSYLIAKFSFIYLYVFFLLIILLLSSSDLLFSVRMWMRFSMPFLCLAIGYDLFSDEDSVNKIWILFKSLILLFLINYVICNVLGLGRQGYGGERFGLSMGNMFYDSSYTNICVLTFIPFALRVLDIKYKSFYVIFCVFSIALTVAVLKRTSIACICISILTYLFVWNILVKKYGRMQFARQKISVKYIAIILCLIMVFAYMFADLFTFSLDARANRFEKGSLEKEGRTRELVAITNDVLLSNDAQTFFIGKETFNTVGTYANGKFGDRNIHDLWGILINGSGIIGILSYAFVICYILFLFFRYKKRVDYQNNVIAYFYTVIFIAYWLMFHMASFGDITVIYPSMTFTIMGLILRYFADGGNYVYVNANKE